MHRAETIGNFLMDKLFGHRIDSWEELELLEGFFDQHNVKSVIEIQTPNRGMTQYLAFQAFARGAHFCVFDKGVRPGWNSRISELAGLEFAFHRMDRVKLVLREIKHPVLFYTANLGCYNTYKDFLWSGDFVAAKEFELDIPIICRNDSITIYKL